MFVSVSFFQFNVIDVIRSFYVDNAWIYLQVIVLKENWQIRDPNHVITFYEITEV